MRVAERMLTVPPREGHEGLLEHFATHLDKALAPGELPVRFVVSKADDEGYDCEVAVLEGSGPRPQPAHALLSCDRQQRDSQPFDVVFLVPTGMGLDMGGHAGDANRVARLLSGCCDRLVTHPNALNAADINEMPDNCLYVEGSVLSRFMLGTIALSPVRANRILVVIDDLRHVPESPREKLFTEAAINSVSAAQATLGIDCPRIVTMREGLGMCSSYTASGRAAGEIRDLERLVRVLDEFSGTYDAVALSSVVRVQDDVIRDYYSGVLANPWGGVEAMLTHTISSLYDVPAAHAPMLESMEQLNMDLGVVDPRMAAEAVTLSAFHCVLKGLRQSPRLVRCADESLSSSIRVSSVACLVTPDGCLGLPHLAAIEQRIPVIAVRDDGCLGRVDLSAYPFAALYRVDNYLEAAGVLAALRAGLAPALLRGVLPDPSHLVAER